MYKINLVKQMTTANGEQFQDTILDEKGKPKTRKVTLRDWLVISMLQNFKILDPKEYHWAHELGILFADSKNKTVEVADDKIDFVRRVVRDNSFSVRGQTGANEEIKLFTPFQVGLILEELGDKE